MKYTEIQEELSKLLSELSNCIILDIKREDASYLSFSDDGKPFGLSYEGYYYSYSGLFSYIRNLENIGDVLSDDFIHEKIQSILRNFANRKSDDLNIDFRIEARNLFKELNVDFQNYQCLIPIIGLSVESELRIGNVVIKNIEDSKKLVTGKTLSFFDDLSSHKESIAICQVKAEWRRATEIAREKTDYILNILRFMGSLVWYNQPTRHVNLKGKDQSRFSYSLVLDKNGKVSRNVNEEFFILPYKIDSEFLTQASSYGFEYYQSLLEDRNLDPLEKSIMIAIQWYGDSTQDLNDLNSFLKSYICIETLLKNEKENAKSVIPRRLSVLLYPFDKSNQKKLEKEMEALIDERNSVFHSGVSIKEKPEYLRYLGRVLGRSVIHKTRLKIKSEGIKTKEELFLSIK